MEPVYVKVSLTSNGEMMSSAITPGSGIRLWETRETYDDTATQPAESTAAAAASVEHVQSPTPSSTAIFAACSDLHRKAQKQSFLRLLLGWTVVQLDNSALPNVKDDGTLRILRGDSWQRIGKAAAMENAEENTFGTVLDFCLHKYILYLHLVLKVREAKEAAQLRVLKQPEAQFAFPELLRTDALRQDIEAWKSLDAMKFNDNFDLPHSQALDDLLMFIEGVNDSQLLLAAMEVLDGTLLNGTNLAKGNVNRIFEKHGGVAGQGIHFFEFYTGGVLMNPAELLAFRNDVWRPTFNALVSEVKPDQICVARYIMDNFVDAITEVIGDC